MPDYQLSDQAWLDYQVSRVTDLLTFLLDKDTVYTQEQILTLLADRGLDYSNPDYLEIGSVLIANGTLDLV